MRLTLAGGMEYWANDSGDFEFVLNVNCAPFSLNTAPSPTDPTSLSYSTAPSSTNIATWSTFFVNPGANNCVTN